MSPDLKETLVGIGRHWVEINLNKEKLRQPGFAVFNESLEVAGWVDSLDRPSSWVPGCLAVSLADDRTVYIAKGGDDQSGAERWEAVS